MDKKWHEAYGTLISELISAWGGLISRDKHLVLTEMKPCFVGTGVRYPSFTGNKGNTRFLVSLSNNPLPVERENETEIERSFLRIQIERDTLQKIKITHRHDADYINSIVKPAPEFAHEDPQVQERYIIRSLDSSVDSDELLNQPSFVEALSVLEPFAFVGLLGGCGVFWSQELESLDQLSVDNVNTSIKDLIRLAELATTPSVYQTSSH